MGAGVLLTIGSLFYVIVLSITYFKKIKLNTLENRIFKMIIISNICGLLLHLILFCMMLFVGTNNIYTIIISKLYLVYLITYMALFTIYTFVISTKKRDYLEENFKKTIIGSALIILLISAFIFYLPIYFYNEPSKMYSYGEAVNLVYVFGFLMIGFNVLFLLKNIKQVLDKKYYPLLFYFSMGLLVSIIQFKYPYIQLITSMHAFIIFLMYLTIENPDIKLAKDLAFSKEIADRSRNKTLETLNNIEDKLEDSLNEMRKFGYKDVDYNDKEEVNHELKYIKNYCIHFVDDISGLIDVSKIDSGSIKIKEDEYETDSLFEDIKQILKYDSSKKLKVSIEIDDKIPESLYGDKNAIKQMILYIYDYLKDVIDKDNLSIKIDFIVVGNFCKLKFYFTTDKIAISKYIYIMMIMLDQHFLM